MLADHPTLNHFTAYIVKMQGGGSSPRPPRPPRSNQQTLAHLPRRPVITKVLGVGKLKLKRVQVFPHQFNRVAPWSFPMTVGASLRPSVSAWRLVAFKRSVSALRVAFEMHPVRTRAVEPCFEPTQSNPNIWHGLPTN